MTNTDNDHAIPTGRTSYADMIATPEEAVAQHSPRASASSSAPAAPSRRNWSRPWPHAARELVDTEIVHLLDARAKRPTPTRSWPNSFRVNSFFISEQRADIIQEGLGDYTPIFLSDIPRLFSPGQLPLDVALIQVTPPDEHGMCSLGHLGRHRQERRRERQPGDRPGQPAHAAHAGRQLHARLRHRHPGPVDEPLIEIHRRSPMKTTRQIGEYIAALVEDGSTVEFGIGDIPQAVIEFLQGQEGPRHPYRDVHRRHHRPDRVRRQSPVHARHSTAARSWPVSVWARSSSTTTSTTTRRFSFHPTEYVNDPFVISQQHKQVAINVALEIDLTGQVCADSLGTQFYSGIGGQVDFNRGAARSPRRQGDHRPALHRQGRHGLPHRQPA